MMKSKQLTKRQREVLDFIVSRIRRDLTAPSIREICAYFGWTGTNAALDHITYMRKKGYVEPNTEHKTRNIILTPKAREEYGLWFVGIKADAGHIKVRRGKSEGFAL